MNDVRPAQLASRAPRLEVAVRPRGSTSGPFVAGLLVVCLFAPYGLSSAGGGTLRPDHLLVPAAFWLSLATGRVRRLPPLGVGYLVLLGAAVLGSFLHTEYFASSAGAALDAAKNVDGLLRGMSVLLLASSLDATPRNLRLVTGALAAAIVAFAVMAVLERLQPDSSLVQDVFVPYYGGPIPLDALHASLGMNHKALLISDARATAVFVTAPALSMAAVFALPVIGLLDWRRATKVALLVAAVVAGLASNSKSFLFGAPLALVALLIFRRQASKTLLIALGVTLVAAAAVYVLDQYIGDASSFNPVARLEDTNESAGLVYTASGGRVGGHGWSVFEPAWDVLTNSPLLGYGFGNKPGVIYSDSALNSLLLFGGIVGAAGFAAGLWQQVKWFYARRDASVWAVIGGVTIVSMLGLSLAGAVFLIPRVNDIVFTLIGMSIAACSRSSVEAPRGGAPSGP